MPKKLRRPPLTIEQILAWADALFARTGLWPQKRSGKIPEAPGQSWASVNEALTKGVRGLPGGSSLSSLLNDQRRVCCRGGKPPLTEERILKWTEAHRQRTGRWPTLLSGAVLDSPKENWSAIDAALRKGMRGLPGGDSLARLLRRHQAEQKKRRTVDTPATTHQTLQDAF